MSELLDNLNEIELQKASFIIPKNLKKNVKALGVTGTLEYLDTTDATAQAKDIKAQVYHFYFYIKHFYLINIFFQEK